MPKSNLYLQRSKYYIHRISAAQGCRLLVPHEFASITEARQFMSTWKGSYYARKPAYSGFLIDDSTELAEVRGSTLIDAAPLPLEPYIPAKTEAIPA